jgi:ribosomal protein S18 acetylase RimI-like enzyme
MTIATPIDVATVQDVPAIQRVAEWSFNAAYGDLLEEELIEAILEEWYATERLREQIANPENVFLIARRGGRVRGYVNVDPHERPGAYFLSRLYVEPSLWGSGTGSELLMAAIRHIDGNCERLELTVLDGNDRAIGFYERRGFEYVTSETTAIGPVKLEEHVYGKDLTDRRQG